jgi:hypothetical protein
MEKMTFTFRAYEQGSSSDKSDSSLQLLQEVVPFKISQYDLSLVKAGGWVDYADKKY